MQDFDLPDDSTMGTHQSLFKICALASSCLDGSTAMHASHMCLWCLLVPCVHVRRDQLEVALQLSFCLWRFREAPAAAAAFVLLPLVSHFLCICLFFSLAS